MIQGELKKCKKDLLDMMEKKAAQFGNERIRRRLTSRKTLQAAFLLDTRQKSIHRLRNIKERLARQRIQPWRGEYVPGPCTHRPSSHESRGRLKSVT